jgi:lipopolysaccharide export system permease protein
MDASPPQAQQAPASPAGGGRRILGFFWPSHLSLYILRQLVGPVAILTLLMTGVIWLVEILPLLDMVINRGQSAPTFLYLILLLLPTLLMIIMPVAFFFATLMALQRLSGDSELVVMAAAGYSLRQLAMPVLAAAAIVMMLTYVCALWLMPAGQRTLRDKVLDIRADVAGALLNEGEFNAAAPGLTIFIRKINYSGEIHGILVHNSRDKARPITYIAEKGILAQTPVGTRLIMLDGTVEQSAKGGQNLSVLSFTRYTIDMDQFAGPAHDTLRKTNERYLPELLWPSEPNLSQQTRNHFFAEAHDRLSQPLYCIAFALIALAGVLRASRQRGRLAVRLTLVSLAAIGLRIAGYGVAGAARNNPALVPLFYVLPLGGALGATLLLAGFTPTSLMARWRARRPPATGAST